MPVADSGPGVRVISAAELGILRDIGYTVSPQPSAVLLLLGMMFLRGRRRSPRPWRALSAASLEVIPRIRGAGGGGCWAEDPPLPESRAFSVPLWHGCATVRVIRDAAKPVK